MLRPQRHDRPGALEQGLESRLQTLRFTPLDLLFHVVEQRHDIAQAILDVDVAVGHGDEQNLQFLGQGGEGEEDCEDVVDALDACQSKERNNGTLLELPLVLLTGSVSMMIFRAILLSFEVW